MKTRLTSLGDDGDLAFAVGKKKELESMMVKRVNSSLV